MARIKIGDVVEIETAQGFVYAHYTHKHEQYGALLRVFSIFHKTRPEIFDGMIQNEPTFMCFFPLGAAINRKICSIAGNVPVPESAQSFPIFRNGVADPSTKKVATWWLWDGENEWRIGVITTEQRKLPILGVINDTLLVERIESGWTAETDAR